MQFSNIRQVISEYLKGCRQYSQVSISYLRSWFRSSHLPTVNVQMVARGRAIFTKSYPNMFRLNGIAVSLVFSRIRRAKFSVVSQNLVGDVISIFYWNTYKLILLLHSSIRLCDVFKLISYCNTFQWNVMVIVTSALSRHQNAENVKCRKQKLYPSTKRQFYICMRL